MRTCFMASTVVTVFPVPGGPNMMYGKGFDVPSTIFFTAVYCSTFFSIFLSYRLKE